MRLAVFGYCLVAFRKEFVFRVGLVSVRQIYIREEILIAYAELKRRTCFAGELHAVFVRERYYLYFLRRVVVLVYVKFIAGQVSGSELYLCSSSVDKPLCITRAILFVKVEVHSSVLKSIIRASGGCYFAVAFGSDVVEYLCILLQPVSRNSGRVLDVGSVFSFARKTKTGITVFVPKVATTAVDV
nr:MAG: hypothetical protein [Bacteriophage sp.]